MSSSQPPKSYDFYAQTIHLDLVPLLVTRWTRARPLSGGRLGLVSSMGKSGRKVLKTQPCFFGASSDKHMGVSENSVPLNPMVNDDYPY